jgi:para-nitrobenzyl esterase
MSETIKARTPYGDLVGQRTVGARRFLPPHRIGRVDGSVDARRPGPAPPQIIRPRPAWALASGVGETDENCLTLNVWTPAPDDARRPVLVHVFGGGFQFRAFGYAPV